MTKKIQYISEKGKALMILILFLGSEITRVAVTEFLGFSTGIACSIWVVGIGFVGICLYCLISGKRCRVVKKKKTSSTYNSTSPGADIATAMTMNGGTYGGPYNFGPYG